MNKTSVFFEFELQNKLFDIVDERGLRPWEAVRYWVSFNIIHDGNGGHIVESQSLDFMQFWNALRRLIGSFIYLLRNRKRDYLCMICSRDQKNEEYYDKISDNLYRLLDKNKTFTIETYYKSGKYKYRGQSCSIILESLFGRLPVKNYDFSSIDSLIRERFPEYSMDVSELQFLYRSFVTQYLFYKFLFKWCGTKKMFMVQDGIKKGLFAAANELGVEINEFQHGQISRNHLAYSYPDNPEVSSSKIYHPNSLLLFGEFWGKCRTYPGVENIMLGNDSYAGSSYVTDVHGNKRILVISNREEGDMLAKVVKDICQIDDSFSFYFKLHPNQFDEFEDYKNIFTDFTNVEIITNGDTVNHLLQRSEAILVVQSTAEFEALQAGRKVFVLKKGSYEFLDFLLGESGVYPIDNARDFILSYINHHDENLQPRHDFFVRFIEDVAKKIINKSILFAY